MEYLLAAQSSVVPLCELVPAWTRITTGRDGSRRRRRLPLNFSSLLQLTASTTQSLTFFWYFRLTLHRLPSVGVSCSLYFILSLPSQNVGRRRPVSKPKFHQEDSSRAGSLLVSWCVINSPPFECCCLYFLWYFFLASIYLHMLFTATHILLLLEKSHRFSCSFAHLCVSHLFV